MIGAEQGRKFNIGALGEEGVVFDGRAKSRKINRFCIGNKMHTMWVAHAHRCRVTGKRQVQCVNCRCQGHLAPHQLRRTHVHPNAAIQPFGPQMPAVCHQINRSTPRAPHDIIRHTARGIATGPGAAAIAVPEIQRKISHFAAANFGQLVKPHAAMPVAQGPC